MTVKDEIIRFLEKQGGEFRAPEGNAGKQIAKELGQNYEVVSTTLHRMVKRGELEKEGKHPRRAYGYRVIGAEAAAPRVLDVPRPTDDLSTALLQALQAHQRRSSSFRTAVAEARQALREADARLQALERDLASLEGQQPPGS